MYMPEDEDIFGVEVLLSNLNSVKEFKDYGDSSRYLVTCPLWVCLHTINHHRACELSAILIGKKV